MLRRVNLRKIVWNCSEPGRIFVPGSEQFLFFIVYNASFTCIHNGSFFKFIKSFKIPSVGFMDVTVEKKFRMMLFHYVTENVKSLMGKVGSVINLVCR